MGRTVSWNFRYMLEDAGKFSCSWSRLAPYASRIMDLESRKRAEIEGANNNNHGWKDRKKLNKELRNYACMAPILLDKRLSQLEMSGKCRAFGFYEDDIFHFVLLDETHEGYKIQK